MKKKNKLSSKNQLVIQNAAKTLFANIRFMSPDYPLKTIVITSSIPNEGKSVVSLNLAQAIATAGKRVLIVEADMRRRTLANMQNLRPKHGVYAVLTEQTTLNEAIVPTQTKNMYFLDVEPHIPNPADILSSKRYQGLIKTLEESFDYVIFDTPPVGTFVDAAILSTLVDGTLLVVRPKHTKRQDLQEAYNQLKKADANVIGACANFCENLSAEYYYVYYDKSGKKSDEVGAFTTQAPETISPSLQRGTSGKYARDNKDSSLSQGSFRDDNQPTTHRKPQQKVAAGNVLPAVRSTSRSSRQGGKKR